MYFMPVFAIVVAGLINRRVPAWSANFSLIAGCLLIGVFHFVPVVSKALARVHAFHFFGIVFASLVIFMFIASAVSPRPSRWVPSEDAQIDLTPWKPAIPIGLALITFVLCVYVYFADFSVVVAK